MLDVATLHQWIGQLGFEATEERASTYRVWPSGPDAEQIPPFYAQCTANWLILSILPMLSPDQPIPYRRLLESCREMRLAKFAVAADEIAVLSAELPTESLDYEEFEDAVLRMCEYALRFRRELATA